MNGLAGTENWSLDIGTRMRQDKAEIKFLTAFFVTAIEDIQVVRFLLRIESCVVAIRNGKRDLEVDEEGKN